MTKPNLEFQPITSSMFEGYHYDAENRELTMKYKNGAVHTYEDVDQGKVSTMVESASPGKFFNDRIKGLHASRKHD